MTTGIIPGLEPGAREEISFDDQSYINDMSLIYPPGPSGPEKGGDMDSPFTMNSFSKDNTALNPQHSINLNHNTDQIARKATQTRMNELTSQKSSAPPSSRAGQVTG
jgi:hypothetical protein